jgi:hypothetical protein
LRKIFEEVFCATPPCPQIKIIPLITITPTIKVQILPVMACWKALGISHPPIKFQEIQLQIRIVVVCPKSPNSIHGIHSPLGVEFFVVLEYISKVVYIISKTNINT